MVWLEIVDSTITSFIPLDQGGPTQSGSVMGCRPSKQATSKVRAIEHKEDPRCLCSPKKVRKNHKCSNGSNSSSKRVSGGIKSGSKKHSFSSGHKPRAAKSADMDFPAFSTTTAVYRKSASKTSKITLRLSCDGSTLEIEQCDYDLERAYGETVPKPRPWSSAPNLSRLRDGKARLFRDSYLPMKHSKSAWSPSVTSTASGSRDCKVRVPVFINTTNERMSSRSLANTSSHRSSNASQTGSCSSRQRESTGKTALPRTYSKNDSSNAHVAYMSLTDANRSLTFFNGQSSPGNPATDGSLASGGGTSKLRAYGNSNESQSGALHMAASCTLENMMNDLECSLQMSHHPAYSSCWTGRNQPSLSCSLGSNQPNFSTDAMTGHHLKTSTTARYVIETSSDDSFHSENSAEFEQIPVNVISSFIAPVQSNMACSETITIPDPVGVTSSLHNLRSCQEGRCSREGDAMECLLVANQTNPNHVSCLKNGLRNLRLEKSACAYAENTKHFKNSNQSNLYTRSEETVLYEPSCLSAKAHPIDDSDSYPNQNSPYLASPIDSNSILTFVTLGCPVSNEMPNFLCSSEDEEPLSLFTPRNTSFYTYDGVCIPYEGFCNHSDGICDHYDGVMRSSRHPSPSIIRSTSKNCDKCFVGAQLYKIHGTTDEDVQTNDSIQFSVSVTTASITNHGHGEVPVSSPCKRKDVVSSRTIDLGPVVEAPLTELQGRKQPIEVCPDDREIKINVSSAGFVDQKSSAEYPSLGLNAAFFKEETPDVENVLKNEISPMEDTASTSESSHSNETCTSSNSESSSSDDSLSMVERLNREPQHQNEHHSMFRHVSESESKEYVYCNSYVNVGDGLAENRILARPECLISTTSLESSVRLINNQTISKDSEDRCDDVAIKDVKIENIDKNRNSWTEEYGDQLVDKQSDSNHSSSSAETIQIIQCQSITAHDEYRHDKARDVSNEKADYLVELLKDDLSQKLAVRHVETRFSYDFDYSRDKEIDTISVSDASDYEISPLCYKYLESKESLSSTTRPLKCGAQNEDDTSSTLTSMQSVRLHILHDYLARLDPQKPSQHDLHETSRFPLLTDDSYAPATCLSPVLEESFSEDDLARSHKGITTNNEILPCLGSGEAIAGDEVAAREYPVSPVPNELYWVCHGREKEEDKQRRGEILRLRRDILAKNVNEVKSHLHFPPGSPLEDSGPLRVGIKKNTIENHSNTMSTCRVSDTKLSHCIPPSLSPSLSKTSCAPPAPTNTSHSKESWPSINVLISGLGRPLRNSERHENGGGIDPRQGTHLNPDNIPGAPAAPPRRVNGGEDVSGCACPSEWPSNNCVYTDRREGGMRADADVIANKCAATARDKSSSNGVFSCLIEAANTTHGTLHSGNIAHGACHRMMSRADEELIGNFESGLTKITSHSPLPSERKNYFGQMRSKRRETSERFHTPDTTLESMDEQTSMCYVNTIDCTRTDDYTSGLGTEQPLNTENVNNIKVATFDINLSIPRDLKACYERDFTQGAETHNDPSSERDVASGARDNSTLTITSFDSRLVGYRAVDGDVRVYEPDAFNAEKPHHNWTIECNHLQNKGPRGAERSMTVNSVGDTSDSLGPSCQLDVLKALEGINNNNNTLSPEHSLWNATQPSSTSALTHGIDSSGPPRSPGSPPISQGPSKDSCRSLPPHSPTSSPAGSHSAETSSLSNSLLVIDRGDVSSINKPTAPHQESQQQIEETERVPRRNVLSLVRYFEKVPFAHRETK